MNTYEYSCSHCNYFIETSGPWPYYGKDTKKRVTPGQFYMPADPIRGLTARVYCPTCDKEKDYIIVQYKIPLMKPDDVWLEDMPRKTRMNCRKCGQAVYLILPEKSIPCPRCKKGVFETFRCDVDARPYYPLAPTKLALRVRQDGKPITVPKPTAIIDSAEHMGYTFARFSNWFSGTIRRRLSTGDYTLLGLEKEIAIERKTLSDLVNSIIQERKRFIAKCEKLAAFKKKCIVIEGSLSALKTPYEESRAHPNAVLGSIVAVQERWDIPIYFLDTFLLAEEFVASMLSKHYAYHWLEANGYERCLIEGDI